MKIKALKKKFIVALSMGVLCAGGLVLYAYAQTWGKTDLEFRIHINEQSILQSVYGESPTFAIWIEHPETKEIQTIYVTSRAGLDDWEGKVDVPSALPFWDMIGKKNENQQDTGEAGIGIDAVSGATPQPGYFTSKARVSPGSKWICWIEMNLSGDYNEYYPEYDEVSKKTDSWGNGQPALVYKAIIEAVEGKSVVPEIVGVSILSEDGVSVQPVKGITTAKDVFDEIIISVVKPKPKIIQN